jgi:hypothetical protein
MMRSPQNSFCCGRLKTSAAGRSIPSWGPCASGPPVGGTTHTTIRGRLIAVGERIDEEIRQEITENRKPDKPAKEMIIGIDGDHHWADSRQTLSRAKCSRSSGTRMATPNSTFRRCYDKGDEANCSTLTSSTSWIGITSNGALRLSEKASSTFLILRISNTGCRDTGIT